MFGSYLAATQSNLVGAELFFGSQVNWIHSCSYSMASSTCSSIHSWIPSSYFTSYTAAHINRYFTRRCRIEIADRTQADTHEYCSISSFSCHILRFAFYSRNQARSRVMSVIRFHQIVLYGLMMTV